MEYVEIEKWILFSECVLEECQRCPNENCLNDTELRGSKGQIVPYTIQPQTDRDKIWENFWVKKGMSMDLVCFWRSHSWSWEAAMSNKDLIRLRRQTRLSDGRICRCGESSESWAPVSSSFGWMITLDPVVWLDGARMFLLLCLYC